MVPDEEPPNRSGLPKSVWSWQLSWVPPYPSKFSKHTFTQSQLITLFRLKIKLRPLTGN